MINRINFLNLNKTNKIILENNLHYKIAVSLINSIGPVRSRQIIQEIENLDELFQLPIYKLKKKYEFNNIPLSKKALNNALLDADKVLNYNLKNDIETIYYLESSYPRRLKKCHDAPVILYKKGDIDLNPTKCVSIVGTRLSTQYGHKVTDELIESFIDNDIVVISGLAKGIDGKVHQSCLHNNIGNIGIIGHGLDRIYPAKHKNLAQQMLEYGNALLTEFVPGVHPDGGNFPMRNRIVAGMSDVTIVIESKNKGGSLITANLANDYNRDVFAVPGSIHLSTSAGCNQLIADNKAHLFKDAQSFLKTMNWKNLRVNTETKIQPKLFVNLSDVQRNIHDIITAKGPIQIDVLSNKSNLPISTLNTELFFLEMEGLIQSLPGKHYKTL